MPRLKAMLANEVTGSITNYLIDSKYAIEQKLDGHRILLICHGGKLQVVNRNHEVSQHHQRMQTSEWLTNLLPFKGRYVVLDAELVDGVAWIFDCPRIEGVIDTDTPWRYRHVMLASLFREATFNHRFQMVPSAVTAEQKVVLVERCIQDHAEGIMIKDRDAPYRPGRSDVMLKYKFVKTADLIAIRIGDEGKEAATLGIWDGDDFVEVGRCSLVGKEQVDVGDVVEVRYLYFSEGGRLVQPVLLRVRDDKSSAECTIDQLQPTSREVISL